MNDARNALFELNGNYQDNKVHVSQELSESLDELIHALNASFISYEIWKQSDDRSLLKQAHEESKLANEHAQHVEDLVRQELNS